MRLPLVVAMGSVTKLHKTPHLTATPGFIVGRKVPTPELKSPAGLIMPEGCARLPVLKLVSIGKFRGDEEEWWKDLKLAENMEVVVKSIDAMVSFGYDDLFIVCFDDICAVLEWV